jgi:hypothetical protein
VVSVHGGWEVSVFVVSFAIVEDVIPEAVDWFGWDLIPVDALWVVGDIKSGEVGGVEPVHGADLGEPSEYFWLFAKRCECGVGFGCGRVEGDLPECPGVRGSAELAPPLFED